MDWSDPVERARLVERVGPYEYNRQHEAHLEDTVIKIVNGHKIRAVFTRFGKLFQVGDTGVAFDKIHMAEGYAATTTTTT